MSNFGIKNIWKNTNSGSNVNTTNLVTTNTNQTISGLKTFSTLPQSTTTPTNDSDLTTKTYVDTNCVNLTQAQTITGSKQFNGDVQFNHFVEVHNGTNNDCSLAFDRDNAHANYVGFYNGGNLLGHIGKASANDTWLTLASDNGNLKLTCPSSSNIDVDSHKIVNVSNPSDNTDAANKQYVDSKIGDWVKIVDNVAINTENTTMTQARDWTDNLNNYTYQNTHTYMVVCKVTGLQNDTDLCFNTVIQTNNSTYDNEGQCVVYDNTGTHVMVIQIHLGHTASKQNRIYYYLPSGFSKANSLALYCWIKDLGQFSNS